MFYFYSILFLFLFLFYSPTRNLALIENFIVAFFIFILSVHQRCHFIIFLENPVNFRKIFIDFWIRYLVRQGNTAENRFSLANVGRCRYAQILIKLHYYTAIDFNMPALNDRQLAVSVFSKNKNSVLK